MTTIIGRYSAHLTQGFFVEQGVAYDTDNNEYAAAAYQLHPDAFDVPNVEPKRGPGRPRKEDTSV